MYKELYDTEPADYFETEEKWREIIDLDATMCTFTDGPGMEFVRAQAVKVITRLYWLAGDEDFSWSVEFLAHLSLLDDLGTTLRESRSR